MSSDKVEHSGGENFATKLGISMVGPKQFGEMMDQFENDSRVVLCGIGRAGLGKSAMARQRAKARNVPYSIMHIPQMSVEDFYLPTTPTDGNKQFYDKRIPRGFQEILEYCEAREKATGMAKKKYERSPMLIIEEPNRANDKNVTKALFTLIEDRMIGDTRIPDFVQIVALMNPTGGGMLVNEFEKDPAYRRRLLLVGVRLAPGEFLNHAEKNFHPKTVEFLRAQTKYIYDDHACEVGKVFANPAAWETVSDICKSLESSQKLLTNRLAHDSFAGKIGSAAATAFVNYLKDADSVISALDVLKNYKEKSDVRDKVQKQVEAGKSGIMMELCSELSITLFDGKNRDPKTFSKQLGLFMDDLTSEVLVDFIKIKIPAAADSVEDGQDYFRQISAAFSSEPAWQNANKRYLEAVSAFKKQVGSK